MKRLLILILLLTNVAFANVKYTFNIAVVTDWQTVQSFGGVNVTKAALQQRINDASKIYEDEMGLQLVVAMWVVPSSASQDFPYDDTQANLLLTELVQYREASTQQCQLGATILMTTRVLTNNIVGLSNTGSACWGQAAGIVEVNFGEPYDFIDTAHEVAHILGADHDGDPNGSCASTSTGMYIMTPVATQNSTNQFSPCTIKVITSQFAEHPCIQAVTSTNSTPAATTAPSSGKGGGGAFCLPSVVFLLIVLGYTLHTKYRRQYVNQARNRPHGATIR